MFWLLKSTIIIFIIIIDKHYAAVYCSMVKLTDDWRSQLYSMPNILLFCFFFLPKALPILLDKMMLHSCMEAKLYMYPLGTMYTSNMQTLLTFQTTNNSFHLENLCSMQFVSVHFIKLFTAFTSRFFQSQLVKVGIIAILE